jgi:hypothetical protein
MKLPNAERASVPAQKITGYLLSSSHRDGRGKAEYFSHFGFSVNAWQGLAKALQQHAVDHEVSKVEDSPFGTRYVIEGMILTPDGRNAVIRSVWFIETGAETPRFVTAYPLGRS